MMLLGTLSVGEDSLPCLIGVERDRVVVVAQDDLSRYSWPIEAFTMAGNLRTLDLGTSKTTYRFTPDLPDRFRWVMTAALQEAATRRARWRLRRGPMDRGLADKMRLEAAAA